MRFNFDKQTGSYYGTKYDQYSIMQYGEKAFSTNGRKTIISLSGIPVTEPYQKTGSAIMTPTDVASVKYLYSCY